MHYIHYLLLTLAKRHVDKRLWFSERDFTARTLVSYRRKPPSRLGWKKELHRKNAKPHLPATKFHPTIHIYNNEHNLNYRKNANPYQTLPHSIRSSVFIPLIYRTVLCFTIDRRELHVTNYWLKRCPEKYDIQPTVTLDFYYLRIYLGHKDIPLRQLDRWRNRRIEFTTPLNQLRQLVTLLWAPITQPPLSKHLYEH